MHSLILSSSFNPWYNLALEDLLFDTWHRGCCLYLWQNQNAVVIGRSQNAWRECRIDALERDGGRLARRTSGGGAVFHDLGNLNFTFIAPEETYDLRRQLQVIISAVSLLGIKAAFTGRNDIMTENGAKFSGNAFRKARGMCLHHGTILINTDMGKLSRYLMPSKAKLMAKGVESVRARVVNLQEYAPGLSVERVQQAIIGGFRDMYGSYTVIEDSLLDRSLLAKKEALFSSWEWNKGASPKFDLALESRFPWGEVQLLLTAHSGYIVGAELYTDAMEEDSLPAIPASLRGSKLGGKDMAWRISSLPGRKAADVAAWLREIEI